MKVHGGIGGQSTAEIWGTWEELLLASAVRRHGLRRWDSVAMEVKARVGSSHALTPEGCEERFLHLQRRFASRGGGGDDDPEAEVPWLEDLRRIRVSELRRELERYDISIMSLQLKVTQLKGERERRESKAAGGGEEEAEDLKADEKRNDGETPGNASGNPISNGVSGRSCNESNSTDPKEEREEKEREGLAAEASEPVAAAGDEKSCNAGSTAESKGVKESSDVQSSASLSKERAEIKSQALIGVIGMMRSSEYGWVLERRLEWQETTRNRSVIRRHVDLKMVSSKLESGAAYTTWELFRDLLLLCNNATLFFPKHSPEYIAATHLRQLVTKEIATTLPRLSPPSNPAANGSEISRNLLVDDSTTASLPPLVACRKHSSTAAKVSAVAVKKQEAREKHETDARTQDSELERERLAKKRKKERPPVSGNKVLRSNKNPTPAPPPKHPIDNKHDKAATALKTEKKNSSSTKEGNAADLLTREKPQDQAVRPTGNGVATRKAVEKGAPVRQGVGRPPKRAASNDTSVLPRKRSREAEAMPSKRRRR